VIEMTPTGLSAVMFSIGGCNAIFSMLPGALCEVAGQSCTTDALGQCTISYVPAGTYTWTVSKSRYATQSGSITVSACGTGFVTLNLLPASGYAFVYSSPGICCYQDPAPTTLSLTDTATGACAMAYSSLTQVWTGSVTWDFPSYCALSASPGSVITYTWPSTVAGYPGCGVGISIAPPSCANGLEVSNFAPPPNPCCINQVGYYLTECCVGDPSCGPQSLTLSADVPVDVEQVMTPCDPTGIFDGDGIYICSCGNTGGCCYSAGAANTITITE
jgi:hypothetical protein